MTGVFVFQAALICPDCAADVKRQTPAPTGVDPADPDESIYDSGDWPKGPFPDGGGEADVPQHCDRCGRFLENPLTDYGDDWLRGQAAAYDVPDSAWSEIADRADADGRPELADWIRFYLAPGM